MSDTIIAPAVTALGILVGAGVTVYQVKRTIPPGRSSLRHDLETLKLAKELKIPAKALEDDIVQRLAKLEPDYQSPKWRITTDVIAQSLFGIILALGLGYLTYHLSKDGFSWWSLLAGFFALGGLGQPFIALADQRRKDERVRENQEKPTEAEPSAPSNNGSTSIPPTSVS